MSKPIDDRGYRHPEMLVDTDWVAAHLDDPDVRVVESNEDPLLYPSGHVPGAVEIDWTRDLNDPLRRDYLDGERFAELMRRNGIARDTTVVLYGDKNNWWATYALWVFTLFGHPDVRIMDGGRRKWEEEGRPMTTERPAPAPAEYPVVPRDDETERVFRDEVLAHVRADGQLVDVRSPEEFSGERMHMPDYPNEGALRGGHIPGASNIPWSRAIDPEDATFLDAGALRAIYVEEQGLEPAGPTVAYCRIGERSSHSWFVLKYLLGFEGVRNYDGSWTEWGNAVGVPIER